MIDGVTDKQRVGVTLDTCHLWAAGFDILSGYEATLQAFRDTVGWQYLSALHVNDSKMGLGSHRCARCALGATGHEGPPCGKLPASTRSAGSPLSMMCARSRALLYGSIHLQEGA